MNLTSQTPNIKFSTRRDNPYLFFQSYIVKKHFIVKTEDGTVYKMKVKQLGEDKEDLECFLFKAHCFMKVNPDNTEEKMDQNFSGSISVDQRAGIMHPIDKIEW